jgi:hypothetical protein
MRRGCGQARGGTCEREKKRERGQGVSPCRPGADAGGVRPCRDGADEGGAAYVKQRLDPPQLLRLQQRHRQQVLRRVEDLQQTNKQTRARRWINVSLVPAGSPTATSSGRSCSSSERARVCACARASVCWRLIDRDEHGQRQLQLHVVVPVPLAHAVRARHVDVCSSKQESQAGIPVPLRSKQESHYRSAVSRNPTTAPQQAGIPLPLRSKQESHYRSAVSRNPTTAPQ